MDKALLDHTIASAENQFARIDFDKLVRDLDELVEHANKNVGDVTISATLYKLIEDVRYVQDVAPRILTALGA